MWDWKRGPTSRSGGAACIGEREAASHRSPVHHRAGIRGGKGHGYSAKQLNSFSLWRSHPRGHRTDRQRAAMQLSGQA